MGLLKSGLPGGLKTLGAKQHSVVGGDARLRSINLDSHSHGDLINDSGRVPVCQADAPVAGRAANRIGAVRTVNANALFVQTNPDDPNRIAGTRRDSVKMAAPPSVLPPGPASAVPASGGPPASAVVPPSDPPPLDPPPAEPAGAELLPHAIAKQATTSAGRWRTRHLHVRKS